MTIKGKEYPVKDQFAKGVQAITAAKDYISFAIAADPHASLAWAGVLLVLPVSFLRYTSRCPFYAAPPSADNLFSDYDASHHSRTGCREWFQLYFKSSHSMQCY